SLSVMVCERYRKVHYGEWVVNSPRSALVQNGKSSFELDEKEVLALILFSYIPSLSGDEELELVLRERGLRALRAPLRGRVEEELVPPPVALRALRHLRAAAEDERIAAQWIRARGQRRREECRAGDGRGPDRLARRPQHSAAVRKSARSL